MGQDRGQGGRAHRTCSRCRPTVGPYPLLPPLPEGLPLRPQMSLRSHQPPGHARLRRGRRHTPRPCPGSHGASVSPATTQSGVTGLQGPQPSVVGGEASLGVLGGPPRTHVHAHTHTHTCTHCRPSPQEASFLAGPGNSFPAPSQPPRLPVWKWGLDPASVNTLSGGRSHPPRFLFAADSRAKPQPPRTLGHPVGRGGGCWVPPAPVPRVEPAGGLQP